MEDGKVTATLLMTIHFLYAFTPSHSNQKNEDSQGRIINLCLSVWNITRNERNYL